MSARRRGSGVVALVALFAIAAAPLGAADPLELQAIVSLTGPGAYLGNDEMQSLQAVEAIANASGGVGGRPIKFVIRDDQSRPQVAVQLFNEIAASKPAAVFGPGIYPSCSAVLPLVKDGPVIYCFSPALDAPKGSFAFSANVAAEELTVVALRNLRSRGYRRLAVITSTDATGQDAERALVADLALPESAGMSLVAREHFNVNDESVAAQIARIKAAAPQALLVWTSGTPLGTVLHAVSDAGLELPIVTSSSNATVAQMQQYASLAIKDLELPGVPALVSNSPVTPAERQAIRRFDGALSALGVKQPDFGHTLAFDPAMILIDALRNAGPQPTPVKVQAYISNLHGYVGVNGTYDFPARPQRGLTADRVIMIRWDARRADWQAVSKPGG